MTDRRSQGETVALVARVEALRESLDVLTRRAGLRDLAEGIVQAQLAADAPVSQAYRAAAEYVEGIERGRERRRLGE